MDDSHPRHPDTVTVGVTMGAHLAAWRHVTFPDAFVLLPRPKRCFSTYDDERKFAELSPITGISHWGRA